MANLNQSSEDLACQVWFCDEEKVRQIQAELEGVNDMALILKALADDTRVKIAYALSKTEMCVCDVAKLIGASSNVASYHLRTLNHLGLARYRKEGKMVYYSLSDEHIANLVREVFEYAREKSRR